MARPPLPIGTWGSIKTTLLSPGLDQSGKPLPDRHRARARFRDADGVTRPVERWGDTKGRAERNLRDALSERAAPIHGRTLTPKTRFKVAAGLWMDEQREHAASTTADSSELNLRLHLLPFLGELMIKECTVPTLQVHMSFLARKKPHGHQLSPNTLRAVRRALSGALRLAVEHGALQHNPVSDLRQIRGQGKKPKSMTVDQVRDLLAVLDSKPNRLELATMTRFALGTGCRVGEIAAVRWGDVNLGDEEVESLDGERMIPPKHVHVAGNIVRVQGKGLARHDGKTFSANRFIALPDFLCILLAFRREDGMTSSDQVFPSPRGMQWRHPGGLSVSLATITRKAGLPPCSAHIFRRTAGTVLDDAGLSARQIADVLGHADPSFTQRTYLGRGHVNTASATALDAAYGG